MPRFIRKFYKTYIKTRPIKFYLNFSILVFLFGGIYYLFKILQIDFILNTYFLEAFNSNKTEFFILNKCIEESIIYYNQDNKILIFERSIPFFYNSLIFLGLSSILLKHLYFLLKISLFFHLFFTLYSVLFDYMRDHMSLTFFLLTVLYFIIFFYILQICYF